MESEKKNLNKVSLDSKDRAILKMLEENARYTVKDIARKVHLSTTPVYERIRRLEESGVIRKYITLLDGSKIDKSLTVFSYISLKQHGKNAGSKFVEAILAMPEVLECFSISGEFDFLLKVVCGDMNEYYNFHVNTLSEIENVGHVQSIFVMGVIKDTHKLIE